MRRIWAGLAALCCLGICVSGGLALATEASTSEIPLAASLREDGWTVEAAMAPLHALGVGAAPPELLVIGGSHVLTAPEVDAIMEYVSGGGEAWLVAATPEVAFARFEPPRALSGALYDAAGEPASAEAGALAGTGLRGLLLPASGWDALYRTGVDAFRDTNGNAALDEGEPVGPFVAAASVVHGTGRLVIVAADGPAALHQLTVTRPDVGRAVIAAASAPAPVAAAGASVVLVGSLAGESLLVTGAVLAAAALASAAVRITRRPPPVDTDEARIAAAVAQYHSKDRFGEEST